MLKKNEFTIAVERLHAPFALRDLDWVPNFTSPKADNKTYANTLIGVSPYVRREAIITRLNVIIGPGNWENKMEPLGKYGLFHGISINCEGLWINKFDGARVVEKNDIDAIKSVVTQSLKRTGELWGIGLYLKFVPQLFAVKRPSDYYDAEETWFGKGSGNDFIKIRWDHPELSKEFLPDYMTPEQYVRMKRIRRYFGEDKRKKVDVMINNWEEDYHSVTYKTAEQIILAVETNLKEQLNAVRPTEVSSPTPPKQQQQSKPKQKHTPAKKELADDKYINTEEFDALYGKVKKIIDVDEAGNYYTAEELEGIKTALNQHHKGVNKMDLNTYLDYEKVLDNWIADAGDNLPF